MEALETDQAVDFVLVGECPVGALFVLGDADGEVAGDANIENSRFAGEDVNVVDAVGVVHIATLLLCS